ncbi:MAG: hypothetical protein JNJ54_17920 [Myxococcaceae bacterium]|nr:hypothetical protein [Myxococcaceae bacterium]
MTAPAPDPRLRPFRGAAWALYLVVSVGFSSLVIFSVTKSVFEMSPGRPEAVPVQTPAVCASRLTALFEELEAERRNLSSIGKAAEADQRWMTFRNGWMVRMRALEAECALDEPLRSELKIAFTRLHQVMDLATVQATQVAGQLGPALDAFRAALAALPAS